MKNSIGLVVSFILGALFSANFGTSDYWQPIAEKSEILLIGLLFFIGVGVGKDQHLGEIRDLIRPKMFIIPACVVAGTFIGVIITNVFTPNIRLVDALAIGSGFGYYSLSSVIIAQVKGQTLAILALASNIFREIFTLLFAPLLTKIFGKYALVASGGATAMDTTLPVIIHNSGKSFIVIAIFSGLVLTFLVPVLVTFFVQF